MPPRFTRRAWLFAAAMAARAQQPEFVCPMDRDVRSARPGKCPRCGMKLVAGLPMPAEYPMEFRATPSSIPAGREITLEFRVIDPATRRAVTHFETVHEKLFHLFLVSQDLEYFSHEHPVLTGSGWFRLRTRLPKPGTYRLLADFDPIVALRIFGDSECVGLAWCQGRHVDGIELEDSVHGDRFDCAAG